MVARLQRFVLVLAILLAFPLAHAATFGLGTEVIDNEIVRGEIATYTVTVTNYNDQNAQFQVYTIDPGWAVKTTPIGPMIPAGETGTFTLELRPTANAGFGTQGVSVTFKDLTTGTLIRRDIVISLRGGAYPIPGYEPTISLDIVLPYDVDPREQIPLRLSLRNRNVLNISNLTLHVYSPHFESWLSLPLPPLSVRDVDVPGILIDPRTPPVEEDVTVQALVDGDVVAQLAKNYRIESYSTIGQEVVERSFAFKAVREITIMNDGNVPNTAVITVPTSLVKSIFTSSDAEYDRTMAESGRVLEWRIPLAAGETRTFAYVENYRVLVLLALIAVLSLVGYLFLRSPIIVVKEAVGIAKSDGVSHLKVRIYLKNRSARSISGITLTDRVPSIADVIKAEAPGSITPSKIAVSEKGGTLLRWELEQLEPYEERVVTYLAKSKLKIIGRISMPTAKARFTFGDKERVVYSNNIEVVQRFKDR